MLRTLARVALLITLLPAGVAAQDAKSIIAGASKAMGADTVSSVTYSGSASNGNFGQSKSIAGPLAVTTITNYTRAIDLSMPASRATGATMPPTIPGAPPPQPGTFNQNITPSNAAWTQQLEIWVTPWGFLKGASANNATVRAQRIGGRPYNVVSWLTPQKSPSGQTYRVNGYINDQNLIDRVETWVEHPVLGDLHVDTAYTNYQDFGGLKVPGRIVQKRAGLQTFDATITSATANPANLAQLMTPPQPQGRGGAPGGAAGGAAPAPPAVQSEKLADGVYRITGAICGAGHRHAGSRRRARRRSERSARPGGDCGSEAGHSEQADPLPGQHARALRSRQRARAVRGRGHHHHHAREQQELSREGAQYPADAGRRRAGQGESETQTRERRGSQVLRNDTRTIELHHVKNLEHSDGMLIAFLPKEKILFTADFNIPAAGAPVSPAIATLVQNVERLKLDFEPHVLVHPPNPDKPQTKADLLALAKKSTD